MFARSFISASAEHQPNGRYPRRHVETTDSTLVWIGGSIMTSSQYRKRCCFSSRGKVAWSRTFPSENARTLEGAFFPGFSRTEPATTKSAKVTRDNGLTSQEEFFLSALEAWPGQRRDPERAANIFSIGQVYSQLCADRASPTARVQSKPETFVHRHSWLRSRFSRS